MWERVCWGTTTLEASLALCVPSILVPLVRAGQDVAEMEQVRAVGPFLGLGWQVRFHHVNRKGSCNDNEAIKAGLRYHVYVMNE